MSHVGPSTALRAEDTIPGTRSVSRTGQLLLNGGMKLARQNYQHEKRQKDLAKKKKQEEKRQRKAVKKDAGSPEGQEQQPPAGEVAP
jgi:hypothetical protein